MDENTSIRGQNGKSGVKYEAIIGLEIHAELNTKTKMFCQSRNDPDEKHPNINICPVCMAHPGTLPVINQEAVRKVISVGLALNGTIPDFSQFDRKNYFYPDLPKGYQISQYEHPLVSGGHLAILGKKVNITRVHLEEDTGRLAHDPKSGASLVDYNRAGVPLMELVTEPDFRTGEEVRAFGEELQRILRYVGASDADMEKGQMRVEVNISLRPVGQEKFGTKVEVKNINSFKYAQDAVNYEVMRQTDVLERGERVVQETRGWNEHKQESFSQRKKEEAHDYRYFPEPDLPPLDIHGDYVDEIRASLPELPGAKRLRFEKEYGLEAAIIDVLVRDKDLAGYYEAAVSELMQHDKEDAQKPKKNLPRTAAAFLTGDFLRLLRETDASVADIRVTPENFAELVLYVAEDRISNLAAKEVLDEMFRSGSDPSEIIEEKGLWQMSDTADLENIVKHIVSENPKAVEDFKAGKQASVQFIVGQVMKETRGRANPKLAQDIVQRILIVI